MKSYIPGKKERIKICIKDEGTILDPKMMESTKTRHKETNQNSWSMI